MDSRKFHRGLILPDGEHRTFFCRENVEEERNADDHGISTAMEQKASLRHYFTSIVRKAILVRTRSACPSTDKNGRCPHNNTSSCKTVATRSVLRAALVWALASPKHLSISTVVVSGSRATKSREPLSLSPSHLGIPIGNPPSG
ncbi:MAG: hypothetical protein GFH27_549279n438 [Chloroflexi bacterium AL-W]|nr:hypothetical protein [Chloroflexi bacterium AL-N1]NOK65404.1 hypothetical protein [Chloroflexi bacterium AL-N10]NOK72330.1 hypothetical protein [Chloroflexi bacterium AL-N5]NOK79583.1 hypothetical protein [Chloroflexi bacterium AL-W]NOK87499.1 hypothetical protein [Chloroflexi bacterium AL-N15]